MIEYLQAWLKARVGAAPVWVRMVSSATSTQFTMHAVDEVGVVLSSHASGGDGVAFPWTSIVSIKPDRATR